jgi:hypothetical protein
MAERSSAHIPSWRDLAVGRSRARRWRDKGTRNLGRNHGADVSLESPLPGSRSVWVHGNNGREAAGAPRCWTSASGIGRLAVQWLTYGSYPAVQAKRPAYRCFRWADDLQSDPRPWLHTPRGLPRLWAGDCRVASLLTRNKAGLGPATRVSATPQAAGGRA